MTGSIFKQPLRLRDQITNTVGTDLHKHTPHAITLSTDYAWQG
jgi:hypothetical protein